jgi:hypothetical protein
MRWDDIADNLLINPDFLIAQEGTSFAALADDTYILDGFVYHKSGAMVHTGSQSTDVPTVAQSAHKSTKSLLVDCTTVDSSIATGDYCYVAQFIEGLRALDLFERAFKIRFWHKHTKTGQHCIAVKNSGSDRTFVAEYTQTTTDTWELATIEVPASPSAGTWNYTNGIGLQIIWTLAAGATYQATAGDWETGDFLATSNQVNNCDSTSNNFRIAQAAVYPGGFDLFFRAPEYAEQLIVCQRYFEKTYNDGTNPGTATADGADVKIPISADWLASNPEFTVRKRANPTITYYNTQDGTEGECSRYNFASVHQADVSCTAFDPGERGFLFYGSNNLTTSDQIRFHYTAAARLRLS